MCTSPNCASVMAAIQKAVPQECAISWMNNEWQLYKDILDPIDKQCAATTPSVPPAPPFNVSCAEVVTDVAFGWVDDNGGLSCEYETGFSFFNLTELPTTEKIHKMCASANCTRIVQEIKKAVPDECPITYKNNKWGLYKDILNPITDECAKLLLLPSVEPEPNQHVADNSSSTSVSIASTTRLQAGATTILICLLAHFIKYG